jgi:hypothetical protein
LCVCVCGGARHWQINERLRNQHTLRAICNARSQSCALRLTTRTAAIIVRPRHIRSTAFVPRLSVAHGARDFPRKSAAKAVGKPVYQRARVTLGWRNRGVLVFTDGAGARRKRVEAECEARRISTARRSAVLDGRVGRELYRLGVRANSNLIRWVIHDRAVLNVRNLWHARPDRACRHVMCWLCTIRGRVDVFPTAYKPDDPLARGRLANSRVVSKWWYQILLICG